MCKERGVERRKRGTYLSTRDESNAEELRQGAGWQRRGSYQVGVAFSVDTRGREEKRKARKDRPGTPVRVRCLIVLVF